MAKDAKVIATTVGPYRRDGLELVDACIANATDYVDLTGEILFAHASLSRHEQARANNVRIVHSCGFDSIPSDLGVLLLHERVGELAETTLVVAAMKGGPSGGTLASMKGQIDEATADKAAAQDRLRPVRARRRPARPSRDLRRSSATSSSAGSARS